MAEIILNPGREKSLLRRHPWIFSGAIQQIDGSLAAGDTVDVLDARRIWLGRGAYSPESQIAVRIFTWDADQQIDKEFFRGRLKSATAARQPLFERLKTDALRLVHAESDGLPGLVVDQYASTLVVQFLSSGAEKWRGLIVQQLAELTGAESIYERSDVDVRSLEGLEARSGILFGRETDREVLIREDRLRFLVDVRQGHKTGFYLDQKLNRQKVAEMAAGKEILDCFCYTGGFSAAALSGGAKAVLAVDSSSNALAQAQRNLEINGLALDKVEFRAADVFQELRRLRDQARSFDLIVLDPPKFAPTSAQAEKAARGYKDINLLGLKLLKPGGLLVTFSCSGGVSMDLFQKILASAADDAKIEARILEKLGASPDHPVALNFPEGEYLKGMVIQRA